MTYTREQMVEQRNLLCELPVLHARLMRAGLLSTGQKMHEVVRESGYEVAAQRTKDNWVARPKR
jgi:hypothetical protein